MDATNLYGHSMSQMLPSEKIEMWHGHPDLYMNKLEEILNIPDDSNIGYFIEVDLKYCDNIKEKIKSFPLCPENKISYPDKYHILVKKIYNYTILILME